MSNERIDLEQFEGMTKGPWRIPEHAAEIVDSEDYAVLWVDFSGESPAEYMFKNSALHCANKEDIEAMAKVPELIAELKRYYGFVDELLNYFHHTILENESFMDLMYRMGVFEFEPVPWQNEKGEWMIFVGDTYETGEWVVDKDFTPNQEE
jgi:hypothetical protein|tara:strand:+ start:599 stop:1051 length:453 start_codon:yes stop_codon:yes gene_type:complete